MQVFGDYMLCDVVLHWRGEYQLHSSEREGAIASTNKVPRLLFWPPLVRPGIRRHGRLRRVSKTARVSGNY